MKAFWSILFCFVIFISCKKEIAKHNKYIFYVGTYTQKEGHVDGKAQGIYKVELDMDQKSLKMLDTLIDVTNPSFLCVTKSGLNLYCVNEIAPNEKLYPSKVSFFEKDSMGMRKAMEAGTYGNSACHIALNESEDRFVISNYMGSTICYGALDNKGKFKKINHLTFNGKSVNEVRQEAPHLHQAQFTNDGYVLVCDLGTDSIRILKTVNDSLIPHKNVAVNAGDGPRHMAISHDQKMVYVLCELSNTISSFKYADGELTFVQRMSTLPAGCLLTSY